MPPELTIRAAIKTETAGHIVGGLLDSLGVVPARVPERASPAEFWLIVADREERLLDAADALVALGQSHLSVLRTRDGAEVGPTYMEPGTACARCVAARLLSNDADRAPVEHPEGRDPEDRLWCAIVYRELWALRTGGAPLSCLNHVVECNGITGTIRRRRILRAPRCPACRADPLPSFTAWQLLGA